MGKRAILIRVLSACLILGGLAGLVALYDLQAFPRYHSVKLGMSQKEVDGMFGQLPDSYPNTRSGWTSYYQAKEGYLWPREVYIVVSFDSTNIAVRKWLE